jgi:hypothetical protein
LDTARLEQIRFLFQSGDAASEAFFETFRQLLAELPHSRMTESGNLFFTPPEPPGALPLTCFGWINASRPVSPGPHIFFFDTARDPVGGLNLPNGTDWQRACAARETRTHRDVQGFYIEVRGEEDFPALLPIEEMYQRLHGHGTRLDHTGLNLPTNTIYQAAWDMLARNLATTANLYRYPTGEPWPFLLPATDEEFATDIRHFSAGRGPKFELVRDPSLRHPLIQIDIHTDLPRAEIERLFPEPYGRAIPGLEAFFRSVYLFHPWPGLSFRVDLRYHDDGPPSDWDTGEWLVTAGGRIR